MKHLRGLGSFSSGSGALVVHLHKAQPGGAGGQVQAQLRLGIANAGLDESLVAPADRMCASEGALLCPGVRILLLRAPGVQWHAQVQGR